MDLEKETTSERSSRCREELTALLMTEPLSVAQIRERIQVGSEVKSAFFTNLLYNMKAAGQINLHVSGRYWVDGFPPDAWDNPGWKRKVAVNTRPPAKRKDAPTVTRSNPTNPKAGPFIAQPTIPPGVNADIAPADTAASNEAEEIDLSNAEKNNGLALQEAAPITNVKRQARVIEGLYRKIYNLRNIGNHAQGCKFWDWDFNYAWDESDCTCPPTIIEAVDEDEYSDDSYICINIDLMIDPGDVKRMGHARFQQILQAMTVLLTAQHELTAEQMAEQSH